MLIINICRLFCIREFVAYHLRVTDLFFRSGKTINKLSCSFFLLLLFCYSNVCAANHQDLVEALKTGNEKMIEQLMQNENIGINDQIEWTDNCYVCLMTPLMWLAKYGHTHIAENFIKKGADVNAKNSDGSTALMFAVVQGHAETVRLLLEHKANINEENTKSSTPLILAVKKSFLQIVTLFVERSDEVNEDSDTIYTPLMYAICTGCIKTVICLMNHGADVNAQGGDCHKTSLMYAAEMGLTQIVTLLVEHGADVNAQSTHEYTSLMYAIFKDHAEIAKYLITVGADVNIEDFRGRTALTRCMVHGEKDFIHIIKLLISKGAGFNISNPVHAKALYRAFKRFCTKLQEPHCRFDILALLLDFVKPNELNNFVVKTFTSGKRSFLFQQKIDGKIDESIIIEDLSALEATFISGSPLQDAVKYTIQKSLNTNELNRFITNRLVDSIEKRQYLPLPCRIHLECFLNKLNGLNSILFRKILSNYYSSYPLKITER
ncbi:MAG: ankyrin repeat domain-containing protein [Endozoicomonadaceae bacterium]|nr:ankyrin repeat domain-containing protein [Endozoicomonadaceae bacterium]